MYKIDYNKTKHFSVFSKDQNLIHLEKKFAKKFFFKKPIVHGINLMLFALNKYLNFNKKFIQINHITVNFKNFLLLDEPFFIKIYKNKILVFNKINIKLEIIIKKKNFKFKKSKSNYYKFYSNKYLINFELINHLIKISYFIGSRKPGNGALIHKLETFYNNKIYNKKKTKFKKIVKNFWYLNLTENFFKSNVITSKLSSFKNSKENLKISKKIKKIIVKKKILVIGSSGDIGYYFTKILKKLRCLLYFFSFRISETSPIFLKRHKEILTKFLIKIKPDYIFYLSSPNIYHGKKTNKTLMRLYRIIYSDYLHCLLKIILHHKITAKVFYPSSIYLNKEKKNKINYLYPYIKAKKKAEEICKKKKFKHFVKFYRLPQFKTRSNYNVYGFYEGKSLSLISKYLKKFFTAHSKLKK